jgi:hypothetical protein
MSDQQETDTPDITAFGYDSFESRWIVQLESELYEARKQREEARVIASKYEDRYFETKGQRDTAQKALFSAIEDYEEAIEQRDRLAEVLNDLWHNYSLTGAAYELIEKALAAVKGEHQ